MAVKAGVIAFARADSTIALGRRFQASARLSVMNILLVGILIGLGAFVLYGFVLVLMAMLGIPLSSKRGNEKRTAIAAAMQQDMIEREAARNLAIRAAEDRLRSQG